jgi:hypothetical protein
MRFSPLTFLLIAAGLVIAHQASAATLYLAPEGKLFGIGQEFTVDVKIGTEGSESINAGEATIRFPSDVLELKSTDRAGSAFKFWVEEPTISNEDGTLTFIGGTSKGITGEALQVLTMQFKAKGAGSATLTIENGTITASDGKGTNVLSKSEGVSIGIGTEVVIPNAVDIPEPERVTDERTLADEVPAAPTIRVPLYPEPDQWYNHLGEVTVFWELPTDILQVSTRLSQVKDTAPGDKMDELFTGRNLGTIEGEGEWYVRVQFRNNIGWGELAYYKIGIDTTAPLPFEIKIDSEASQNPSPEIRFQTSDELSGIKEYIVLIDGTEAMRTASSSAKLPAQRPGTHEVVVRAVDNAGNTVEDDLEFEIIPIPAPIIAFITKTVSQEDLIFASGEAVPSGMITVRIHTDKGKLAYEGKTESDEAGNWSITVDELLPTGKYKMSASAVDSRGAISLNSLALPFKVRAKAVLSIGFIDLSWYEIFVLVVLLVMGGTGVVAWRYALLLKKRTAYMVVASRDVEKLCVLLESGIQDLGKVFPRIKITESAQAEIDTRMSKVKNVIARMKKYLSKEFTEV